MGALSFNDEMLIEIIIIIGTGIFNNGAIFLISLDDGGGVLEVATTDAANNLSKKMKGALLGGIIREGKAGISLDDADGGEFWQVETLGDGLSTDDDVDVAGFNFVIFGV